MCGNHDACAQGRVPFHPVAHVGLGVRHQRKQRILRDDSLIQRRRLEKHQRGLGIYGPQVLERRDAGGQQLRREHIARLALEHPLERGGQQRAHRVRVDAPHDAVLVEGRGLLGREVPRDEWRIRPVEQPGWQPMVLRQRQPVQTESWRASGRCSAYLMKLRSRCRSIAAGSSPMRRRPQLSACAARATPRKARVDRKRRKEGCQLSA